jgi:uncharacterized protein
MLTILIYLLGGALAGLLAGLLGIGGGLVIVPFLAYILPQNGIAPDSVMRTAVATSLAVIIFTSLSSIRAHHRRGGVQWDLVKRLFPGIVSGALLGAIAANFIANQYLKWFFAIFVIYIAVKMVLQIKAETTTRTLANQKILTLSAASIAALCSLLGMGGGAFLVPYLRGRQVAMIHAVATSAVCGFPIALVGATTYIVSGWGQANGTTYSLGYVYLPALVCISLASVSFAPLGARLAHHLQPNLLQRIFAIFLFIIAADMLLH